MEQARRPALADHVHRIARMGARVLINGTWYNRYIDIKQSRRLEENFVKPPLKIVRSGKNTRVVAQDRDAQFMTDLEAFLLCPTDPIWESTSVSKPLASYLFPSVSTVKLRSKRQTWWQSIDKSRREFNTPSDARSMSVYLKAEYLMLALREIGPVHSFTLNLHPDIAARAWGPAS